jgi:propanediol dehydratase large subunit
MNESARIMCEIVMRKIECWIHAVSVRGRQAVDHDGDRTQWLQICHAPIYTSNKRRSAHLMVVAALSLKLRVSKLSGTGSKLQLGAFFGKHKRASVQLLFKILAFRALRICVGVYLYMC